MTNIIIIKTGQTETFVFDKGGAISLGDVLRTTSLLRVIDVGLKIHWLTNHNAMPLLPDLENLQVSEFDINTLKQIPKNDETIIINLERDVKLVEFLEENKKNLIGFIYQAGEWLIQDCQKRKYHLDEWLYVCREESAYTWGAMLQKLLCRFSAITVPIFKKPDVITTADIGFNWHVGNKWPSKKISPELWKKMESEMQSKYKISWQKGLDSIYEYAKWIASNRLIISVDSLGVHLANAMNIPVIALFGSTDYKLHDAGPRSRYVAFDAPKAMYECMPCWKSECFKEIHCSQHLDFNKIYGLVSELLNEQGV